MSTRCAMRALASSTPDQCTGPLSVPAIQVDVRFPDCSSPSTHHESQLPHLYKAYCSEVAFAQCLSQILAPFLYLTGEDFHTNFRHLEWVPASTDWILYAQSAASRPAANKIHHRRGSGGAYLYITETSAKGRVHSTAIPAFPPLSSAPTRTTFPEQQA